jgi:hypothetical protein
MRRLALLTCLALLALAPSASAFIFASPIDGITGSGTFGGNTFSIDVLAQLELGPGIYTGSMSFATPGGLHAFSAGPPTCLHVDPSGTSAEALFVLTSKTGEPDSLYGVLIRALDTEPLGTNTGVGDRMDITNLNLAQYNRQALAGCALSAAIVPRGTIGQGSNLAVARNQLIG